MTPPQHVLQASFNDPVKPTEICYIMVVGTRSSKPAKKQEEPVSAKENVASTTKPRFRLTVDQDDCSAEDCSANVPVKTVQPRFKLFLEEDNGNHEGEEPSLASVSDLSSFTSLSVFDDEQEHQGGCSNKEDECYIQLEACETSRSSTISDISSFSLSNDEKPSNDPVTSTLLRKLDESRRRERKLEAQLRQSGVAAITEDIPYGIAKAKVNEIAARLNSIGDSEEAQHREEKFKLEQDMEHYSAAMMLTDEWQEEQEKAEQQWEHKNLADNWMALQQVRRHMPVLVRRMTTEELSETLPKDLVKRFKRTDVLQLLRINPLDIERMHPSMLESMRCTGLILTERRALHAHLSATGAKWKTMQADSTTARKYTWFKMMTNNFRENLNAYQSHIHKFGPPEQHCCSLVGRNCPVVANAAVDYSGDYGYPVSDEYETSNILTRSKQESRNVDAFRQKGNVDAKDYSLAKVNCESNVAAMITFEEVSQSTRSLDGVTPVVTNDAPNATGTSIIESSLPTKSTGEAVDSSNPGNG